MPKNPSETGRQCTVAKVRNWIGEGTFAGARSNDEDAPFPAVRGSAMEPLLSTRPQRAFGQGRRFSPAASAGISRSCQKANQASRPRRGPRPDQGAADRKGR
jgi:hypothetical protein